MNLEEVLRARDLLAYRIFLRFIVDFFNQSKTCMLKTMKHIAFITALLLASTVGTVQADPRNGFAAKQPHKQQSRMSSSEAAARIQSREGGKILAVETIRGGAAYRVKILNRKGQVRVFTVEAGQRRR